MNYQDCQAALSGRSEMSAALHLDRVKQRDGHVANMPGADDMEE